MFMGGVDLSDQVMCYYSIGRKSMKWWRQVLWRLIDTRELILPLLYIQRGPGHSPSQIMACLTGKHFPYRSEQRKCCGVCGYKKVHSRGKKVKDKISTWCPKSKIDLCIGHCFEVYHTRVNYKH